jgi:hypothetical protein
MAVTHVVGIDPGLGGGIAIVQAVDGLPREARILARTPVVWTTKKGVRRREYDLHAMVAVLRAAKEHDPGLVVALERGGARPHQGTASTYRTGLGVGLWQGIAAALGCPLIQVSPVAWKRACGLLGCDKRMSRLRAVERFPGLGALGPADEGGAEAVLIALAAVGVLHLLARHLAADTEGPTQ